MASFAFAQTTETGYTLVTGSENLASFSNSLTNYAATNSGMRRHSILGNVEYVTSAFTRPATSVPPSVGKFGLIISLKTGATAGRLVNAGFFGNYAEYKQFSTRSNSYYTRNIHRASLYQFTDLNSNGVFDPDTERGTLVSALIRPQFGTVAHGRSQAAVYTYFGRTSIPRAVRLPANGNFYIAVSFETSIVRAPRADESTTYQLSSPNGMTFMYSAD
jgi:hypothetical protein